MRINETLYNAMRQNNSIITTAQAEDLGFSRSLLCKYVNSGELERIRHGVYILPDVVHDDMYTLSLRSEHIIFSHETSLFLNGLSERTPFIHSVTIPSNTSLPSSIKDECKCYYVKSELHEIGADVKKTTFGNEVHCYNTERTICDIVRSRSRVDEETLIDAVKKYAKRQDKDLNLLAEYAYLFDVEKRLRGYLEVLL